MAKRTRSEEIESGTEPTAEQSELEALRALAALVAGSLECGEEVAGQVTPAGILREALRCASEDFELVGQAVGGGEGFVSTMFCLRAERRIGVALALSEYHETYVPPTVPDDRPIPRLERLDS